MTELQEARRKWLDAESRCLELQAENVRLIDENHRLNIKSMSSQCEAVIMGEMVKSLSRAMLTV